MSNANNDCYVDSPDNVSVSGGYLHLSSRVESAPFVCHRTYGDFTTTKTAANVVSYGKFTQTYGRFEFRAKFPTASLGYDSALWMSPQVLTYGAWPNSGEIDVAEWFGNAYSDHVVASAHYLGETSNIGNCVVPGAATGFHNYAVDWTATTMYYYFDDQLCFQHSWNPAAPLLAPKPFDQAFYMTMTQTGVWNAPVGVSATMDLDWVRAWK
ncbi:MAG: hypothetical protein JWQ70_2035 [Aeromicrobium sp.]|jgi:beta-glucanase (GH16 family)|nr:hypothetical protein [Aeromicrobium sp.]